MNITTTVSRIVNYGAVFMACAGLVVWMFNSNIFGTQQTLTARKTITAPAKPAQESGQNATQTPVQTKSGGKTATVVKQDVSKRDAKTKSKTQSAEPKSWVDRASMNDLEYPKWQKYVIQKYHDRYYLDAYKILELDATTTEALRELLAEKRIERGEALKNASTDSYSSISARVNTEYDEKISALLGPEKFAQLREYETTLPERNQINQFRSELEFSSEPMTVEQETLLLSVIENYVSNDPYYSIMTKKMAYADPIAAVSTIKLTTGNLNMFSSVLTQGQIAIISDMIQRRKNSSSINYPWSDMGNQMRKPKK